MRIHTITNQSGGIINVTLQAQFVGDLSDPNDKVLIAAFGDPQVNIAGTFVDPANSAFTFQFPTTEQYVGITTQLSSYTAQFMLALPSGPPNAPAPVQGALSCITPNPAEAATAWQAVVVTRISQAMQALRSKTVVPVIPDVTV